MSIQLYVNVITNTVTMEIITNAFHIYPNSRLHFAIEGLYIVRSLRVFRFLFFFFGQITVCESSSVCICSHCT